jgi:hypothetical protein
VVAVIVVVALVFIIMQFRSQKVGGLTKQVWYSTDDGQTFFHDEMEKASPHNTADGKEAIRVYVYKCKDGKPFVAYMERYTPEALALFDADRKAGVPPRISAEVVGYTNVEVKKPGEKEWVKLSDRTAAQKATQFTCPDGTRDFDPVY